MCRGEVALHVHVVRVVMIARLDVQLFQAVVVAGRLHGKLLQIDDTDGIVDILRLEVGVQRA